MAKTTYMSEATLAKTFSQALATYLADGYEFHFFRDFKDHIIKKGAFLFKEGQLYLLALYVKSEWIESFECYPCRLSLFRLSKEAQEGFLDPEKFFSLSFLMHAINESDRYYTVETSTVIGYSIWCHKRRMRIVLGNMEEAKAATEKVEEREKRDKREVVELPDLPYRNLYKSDIRRIIKVDSEIPSFKRNAQLIFTDKEMLLLSASHKSALFLTSGFRRGELPFRFKYKELLKTIRRA